ncbi:unnamed protein product [Clonostachys rhizophaga]|uniref:Uncharacterized protein n=1 Tax=Clonostachys rhizophaga TaxID=160324 RepID=A0A9N9VER6_9HYPO|nr:unnamed protein product [Clonostachys rhizophaga]
MEELKIARIDVFQVGLPYRGGVYRLLGGREYKSFDATIVRITTQNGIAEIAPKLIGLDPRRVDRVYDAMDAALVGHSHAKTALDVACWDIFGKATGLPICELLGGRTDVKMPIIDSCPVTGPAETLGDDPTVDAERIAAALADKKPGVFVIVDANGGMTIKSALRMLRQLPPGLDFVLEAPCATWRETLALRRRTDVPIFLDELAVGDESIIQIIADDAADGIGLKLSKNGGLTKGRRHRDICVAAGLTISVQETAGSEIALSAIVHLGQTIPGRNLRTIFGHPECCEPHDGRCGL